ncbi:hypothetical protein [Secundilactobacillus kimchicus]|uniref:hypothetical protein n=1 Tax=Secundilactobacillus kimchicus TaxID=528209 RepID=UPI0024A7E7EE|nr:hypothetical protein [Secundilactobacillus kimchicus]
MKDWQWQTSMTQFVKLRKVQSVNSDAANDWVVNDAYDSWIRLDKIIEFHGVKPGITFIEPFGAFRISEGKLVALLEGQMDEN